MNPFVGALIGPITDLISEFITDKDKAQELAYKIATRAENQAHEINLAQIETNRAESRSGNLFASSWRPAAGWVCVLAMANNYLALPYFDAFSSVNIPTLDLGELMPVLMGLLGMSTLRSWEKAKGVARAQ